MKLFLLADVKGKGKSGDIIEVKDGYAQFLIRDKKALDYESNKTDIKNMIAKKQDEENDALQLALHLAGDLSTLTLKLYGKLSPKGSLIKKITKNDILLALPDKFKSITKEMLQTDNISTLGTFDIPVRLNKQVTGNLRVQVDEVK